jgi:hypothetical protein
MEQKAKRQAKERRALVDLPHKTSFVCPEQAKNMKNQLVKHNLFITK